MKAKSSKRGYVVSTAVLIVLLAACWLVFRDKLPEILAAISSVSWRDAALILALGLAYQLLDALKGLVIVRARLPQFNFAEAFALTMTSVFGLVLSNSVATIPLQSLYLHTDGLDVGHGVGLMTVKYIFHKSMVFALALIMLVVNYTWLAAAVPGVMPYLWPGFAVCAGIIAFLVLVCTWDKLRLLFLRLLDRLPDKGALGAKKASWRESIDLMYTEMQQLLARPRSIAAIIAIDAVKLATVYAVPLAALRALGGGDALTLTQGELLTALVWLIAGVLPNVSGLGPLDVAFALLFGGFAGAGAVSAALVLYRVATYFAPFAVSLPTVFIMQRVMNNRLERDK